MTKGKNTPKKTKSPIERAAEIKRDNPDVKYYEAMEMAKDELDEME